MICQGFSRHVNKNSGKLRDLIVNHKGRKQLEVKNNRLLDYPEEWKEVIPLFIEDIKRNTRNELVEILSPDFSTTTSVSKIACEITILDTFKSFFEYTVVTAICGIPTITLEGSEEDWFKLKKKTEKLAVYDLHWWVESMIPILDKIIETKQGVIDKPFWRNMYKTHTPKEYGASEKITGWITNFFPYDRFGARTTLRDLNINNLPDELVYADFEWKITDGLNTEIIPMQFVAGFIGLHQCPSTFSLTPEIGWFVCEATKKNQAELPVIDNYGILSFYQLDDMPKEILKYEQISELGLSFNEKVNIPNDIAKIKIGSLFINGEINEKEMNRIRQILPFTFICFNGDYDNAFHHREKKNYFYKFVSKVRDLIRL